MKTAQTKDWALLGATRYSITKSRSGHYTIALFDREGYRRFIRNKLTLDEARVIGKAATAR